MISQTQKLLDLLDDGLPHSNFEIHEKTNILRYSARILDLKRKGYLIRGFDDEHNQQKYWYQLIKTNLNGQEIKTEDSKTAQENCRSDLQSVHQTARQGSVLHLF